MIHIPLQLTAKLHLIQSDLSLSSLLDFLVPFFFLDLWLLSSHFSPFLSSVQINELIFRGTMEDWGPVFIAVMLFVLLTPGLLFQLPSRGKVVEFGNMQTSGVSILVHAVIYFGLITIFLLAIGVHVNIG